ncbi:hypothetical protein GW932_05180 [archaeon]|nr:hypothetical protein [archaeon]
MSETNRIIRKFERSFLGNGYNNCTEIRPDTKGALFSEVQESERRNKQYQLTEDLEGQEIGMIIYGKNGKPDKFFRYKSRGKAGPSPEILGTVKVNYDKNTIEFISPPRKNSDLEEKFD